MKEGREDGDNEGVTILIYLEGIFAIKLLYGTILPVVLAVVVGVVPVVSFPLRPGADLKKSLRAPPKHTVIRALVSVIGRHHRCPSPADRVARSIDTRTGCMKVKRLLDEITRPSTKGIRLKFNHAGRGLMPIAREVSAP